MPLSRRVFAPSKTSWAWLRQASIAFKTSGLKGVIYLVASPDYKLEIGVAVMTDDNIIKMHNVQDVHIPEIQNRSGSVKLVYGGDVDEESVQIEGSITLSE